MYYVCFLPVARLFVAVSSWPFAWARSLLQRPAASVSGVSAAFDLARTQYATAVQSGLVERSLLASSAFERRLGLLERLTLGPWARRV